MICECNNKSNRVKPGIKHVYGNVLRMAIPLTLRTLVKDGDEMVVTDTDFIPSSDHPVRVVFSRGKTNYPIIATMDGNVAIVEDKGKIPVGTYDISVECYDDLGNPYRFKQNAVLYVADTTAEAGIDEEIEYEAQTWYLNAAVFLATTEIGEIGDAIDAKLDDVFGNVAYDANAKEIRFYNKGNSKVLATIDSSPFIADGTVADVYIDVSRQVLVVVLNEDAGGRMFSVPLYLIFNSYYKKDEVDSLVSSTVKGLRFDFSQELPLVVPVTKNGSSYSSPVDFGAIENAIREDGRLVVACVNDDIFYQLLVADRAEIAFSRVVALDGYQELLIVDPHNVWRMEDVDLAPGGGGGGYEPPAGGIPKTDLASGVQASLNKADSAIQGVKVNGTELTPDANKKVDVTVPTKLSDLAADATHRVVTDTEKSTWNGKQDAISDLATIRSGAAAGATALQSYTETDPTVPAWAKASTKPSYTASEVGAVPTTRTVNGKALSSNITLSASDVGADVLIVNITYSNGTIISDKTYSQIANAYNSKRTVFAVYNTMGFQLSQIDEYGIKFVDLSQMNVEDRMNVIYINASNSISYDEIYYQRELISGTNIKTINNRSLLGSGNLTASDIGVVTPIVNVASTGNVTQELQAGAFYKFGTVDSLTITLASGNTPLDGTTPLLVYGGKFTINASSSAASLLALPASVTISPRSDSVDAGKTYEFNIADNEAIILEM